MAPQPTKPDPEPDFLKRPLYAYDLPPHLLSTLVLKSDASSSPSTIEDPEPEKQDDSAPSTATSCNLCSFTGTSVVQQRDHVKSDFHAFNMKRRARALPAVGEAEFEKMVEELSESISGSDSDEDGEEELLSTLLKKKAVLHDEDDTGRRKQGPGKAPIQWYTSLLLPENTSLGVYRALFPAPTATLGSLQNPHNRHVFLLMLGGGHFAAMLISLPPKPDRSVSVLAHKTFHRYTTRRKQGGAQSSNDAAKGNAHSAGAGIRRANEAALMAEIRALLENWKPLIDSAELCFVRATGNQNRKTVFGYEGAVLKASDPRVKGFPFSTRRATQKECVRAFVELTRVKVSNLTEEALAASAPTAPAKPASPAPPPLLKLTPEQEEAMHHTQQLTSLIRRSKVPALLSYLATSSINPKTFRLYPDCHHTPTLLHLASSSASPAIVSALLTKSPADPTLANGDGKTAFEIAADRSVRDAFRIARGELGEHRFDWAAAKVPRGLSKEEVRERTAREEAEERSRRQGDVKRLEKEWQGKTATETGAKGRRLVALGGRELEERGLSEDARKRLERERRARAAEERIRRLQQGG